VRWLADECVDASLVRHLRATGHDVASTAETAAAATDAEILVQAQIEGRLLLTEDKDFGDLVFRRGQSVPGVVLLRIDPAKHELKAIRLSVAIDRFGENLFGRYTIIEEARFRGRSLPK
jgi:predicted nuclease of predicted toxin-antitoxin system